MSLPEKDIKDLQGGDLLSATWLNGVKNRFNNLSVEPPLTLTKTASGFHVGIENSPFIKLGIVISDFVWSDTTYVKVKPLLFDIPLLDTSNTFSPTSTTIYDKEVHVYLTNPLKTNVADVSDITRKYEFVSDDYIFYIPFGNNSGLIVEKDPDYEQIRYGKPTVPFTSGITLVLQPCDIYGNNLSLDDVSDVYIQPSKADIDLDSVVIGGIAASSSYCSLSSDTVCYFTLDNGEYTLFGSPVQEMVDWKVVGSDNEIYSKVRYSWGNFTTNDSVWMVAHEGSDCE